LVDTAQNIQQVEYRFIHKNPNSLISAFCLSHNLKSWSKDTVASLFKPFPKWIKNTEFGKEIEGFVTFYSDLKIGDNYIYFSQKDTANYVIRLSDIKGKLILLEFWALGVDLVEKKIQN
jgi:hypothetical protein